MGIPDQIIETVKIITGTSLKSPGLFRKRSTSGNTEDLEAFALDLEMQFLPQEQILSREEKDLTQVCLQLYTLLQNDSIAEDLRA